MNAIFLFALKKSFRRTSKSLSSYLDLTLLEAHSKLNFTIVWFHDLTNFDRIKKRREYI